MKLKRYWMILLIWIGTFFGLQAPIEAQTGKDQMTVIVEIEGDPYERKEYIETYHPFVQVEFVYDTLLNALALKGKREDLIQLSQQTFIKVMHYVQTYRVPEPIGSTAFEEIPSPELNIPYTGEGVKVGVIDTGIDYRHPDLKENYKGGYDVVEFDEDPMETMPEDGMPTIHGTHVSGIIAAKGKRTGVAPDAEIYGYRALGPGGFGTSVQVIAALEKAVEDGMDIINLSLGNSVNSPDWPTSVAVNKAIDMGVAVVIANGNDGPGKWTVSSPATAVNAISVGASIDEGIIPFLEIPLMDKRISLSPLSGSVPWDIQKPYKLLDGGLGKKPLSSLEGALVLMKRGEISFGEKAKNAEEAGARGVIIYNHNEETFQGGLDTEVSIPVVSVSREDGEWLIEHVIEKNEWVYPAYEEISNDIADFSSRGPVVVNWDIKPDLVAPGVNITSTIPDGQYESLQGTSMAAPYVAGTAALIKEAHPDWGPEKIKAALLTTALPLKKEDGSLYDPIVQGVGRIQPEKAIDPPFLVYNSRLTFGKLTEKENRKKISLFIENRDHITRRFTFDYPERQNGLVWRLPGTLYIPPGETEEIEIELKADSDRLEKGLHQGWLSINSQDQTIQLPYIFVHETADYPRAGGLDFSFLPLKPDEYRFQIYLPEGADQLVVELYDPDTLQYQKTLIEEEDVRSGMYTQIFKRNTLGLSGNYLMLARVLSGSEYDSVFSRIYIDHGGS
ncbi:minor extracellular serine protease Vpr [Melghiribacillus thermohalophilus]|uniref:Minor extracellular serine protease Vpr n=1 Tax=Melghiribacillus thermohalophilus TaxID=1324956 RepID=A0A4R3NCC1_9BACI|nr:minor extracellular serine protease Vpr [Melghiribacillus thermohalophilus]